MTRLSHRCAAPLLAFAMAILVGTAAGAATRKVGPGRLYATPCSAFAAAADGDTIEIDASGAYAGDTCAIERNRLKIRGVNGRPKIAASGHSAFGRGIWLIRGADTEVENVELSGARVPNHNGAGIWLDGRNLHLRGVYLHDNENGLLTSNDGVSELLIDHCEFARNGYGDGYSHNLYVGHVARLEFRDSLSHDANVGHDLKSRARLNLILRSRFYSGAGQPSYEIDLPNAGTAFVVGNFLQQPAVNQNPVLLAFGEEGASNPTQDLHVSDNVFVNDDTAGSTFIMVGPEVKAAVRMRDNRFSGTGRRITQHNAIDHDNRECQGGPDPHCKAPGLTEHLSSGERHGLMSEM